VGSWTRATPTTSSGPATSCRSPPSTRGRAACTWSGRTPGSTAPTLVSPKGDPAAFNASVAVNRDGQVAVLFQDFRNIGSAPASVLPTTTFVRVASGPSFDFDRETQVSRPFNFLAAPRAGGFFVGDYNAIVASPRTGGFSAVFGATDCADTRCTAIANPTGAPTGGLDPTDIFTNRVAGGADDGNGQD